MQNLSRLTKIQKVCYAGMMAALIFVVTWLVRIPVPLPVATGAYINIGDSVCFIAAYLLGGFYGAAAAAVGSAFADLAAGAAIYLPATFVIKAVMAMVFAAMAHKGGRWRYLLASAVCGLIMTTLYAFYELVVFGGAVAVASAPYNLIQAAGSAVIALPAYQVCKYMSRILVKRS